MRRRPAGRCCLDICPQLAGQARRGRSQANSSNGEGLGSVAPTAHDTPGEQVCGRWANLRHQIVAPVFGSMGYRRVATSPGNRWTCPISGPRQGGLVAAWRSLLFCVPDLVGW